MMKGYTMSEQQQTELDTQPDDLQPIPLADIPEEILLKLPQRILAVAFSCADASKPAMETATIRLLPLWQELERRHQSSAKPAGEALVAMFFKNEELSSIQKKVYERVLAELHSAMKKNLHEHDEDKLQYSLAEAQEHFKQEAEQQAWFSPAGQVLAARTHRYQEEHHQGALTRDLTGTSTQCLQKKSGGRYSSLAPLTQQDRLQIALALHVPVERDAQAALYQELSEEALIQRAETLLQALQDRAIFIEGEIRSKEGFAEAVQTQYAITYRGMVATHQLVGDLYEGPDWEDGMRRFQDDFLAHLRGDYHEESLAAKKGCLGMLLSIAENLAHRPSTYDADLFDALEEAILSYQGRYPRIAQAMQQYLQRWLRANPEN
jgi:hypothetical protein